MKDLLKSVFIFWRTLSFVSEEYFHQALTRSAASAFDKLPSFRNIQS
jgi:hypothetical protein